MISLIPPDRLPPEDFDSESLSVYETESGAT